MRTWKILCVVMILLAASLVIVAQSSRDQEIEVRNVISRFEVALQKHDIPTIQTLVAPDIVVFENGHRNDGWQDFRDHHLLPEFKASNTQYKTEVARIEITPGSAWAYSRMNRAHIAQMNDKPDVWTIYVLRKNESGWKIVMLDWSVRRVE